MSGVQFTDGKFKEETQPCGESQGNTWCCHTALISTGWSRFWGGTLGGDPPLTVCKRRFGNVLEARVGEVSGDGGSEQPFCPSAECGRTSTAQHCGAQG